MATMDLTFRDRIRLIVGIDYGTTYSGLSFAMSNASDFRDIHAWTDYPGSPLHNAGHCEKAPSWIALKDDNPDLNSNAWGYQVESGMKTYAWTKLLLDDHSLPTEYDDPDLKKIAGNGLMKLPPGKSPKSVVTEYLRGLYAMYKKALAEKVGADKVRDLPVDYWLTVPATWSERAKLLTKEAAMEAGFGSGPNHRLFLIAEPEAAAHIALKSSIHHVDNLIREGTGVMVCDLGGGTVDIATYEVTRVQPTLKLREITIGQGGKCGGTFVDRNLYKLLAARFGTAFTALGPQHVGPGSRFMDDFELKKRDFCLATPSSRPYRLGLAMRNLIMTPGLRRFYDEDMGQVIITRADMKSLFDPVVERVLRLVRDQVDQVIHQSQPRIQTMVLVGGFGCSPYMKERLQSWCEERLIRLTVPWTGAWSSVVCGAVLRGIEGSISSEKKCRRHYGHAVSHPYDPLLDASFDRDTRWVWKYMFDPERRQFLTGYMSWKIHKGSTVNSKTEINHQWPFQINGRTAINGYEDEVTLYSCSLDDPPETIESDYVEVVGVIKFTLEDLDLSKIKTVVDESGVTYYQVYLTLNIRLGNKAGVFLYRVLAQGKEVGRAQLGFSHS